MPPQRNLECFAVEPTVARIELESTELVSKCPVTGQTDLYKATIAYRPNGRALETKSLKLYLATFQPAPEGIFAAHLADRLAGHRAVRRARGRRRWRTADPLARLPTRTARRGPPLRRAGQGPAAQGA